ncbi:hypothetical protein [uncultured Croceitalea sp.]|uniref:RHS repeat domain-containing protein n=1 Tax=uncultured Croceitalea sp. TaxID=1798908 RepID=UPI003305DD67
MYKKTVFFLFIFTLCTVKAQKDVTVPDVTSFDQGIGSQSAVNLSNGKLSFPLQLVSLKGYKDLNVQFGIAYDGSQVPKHAEASNEILPSGVLGLGWGMQMPRILADNKLTAARDDDDFYLFEGGSLNKLLAIDKNNNVIEFRSSIYKPWKIFFYQDLEKWEIIKENGYTYTYDYVDWVLYWENWIGNSNASGAERQGSGWSLTEVRDLYGNKVTYSYFSESQNLSGSSSPSLQHTEATYLQTITGNMGERIELIYADKTNEEYYEPNTNTNEPDAYQEMYEKKYLSSVRAFDTKNNFLYRYDLNYDFIGQGEFRKRLLTNIDFVNANNDTQLYREFQYDTDSSSDFYGMLLHQILPTKGRVSYQYATRAIEVDQIFNISANDNSSFVVQKDYILKFTFLQAGANELLYMTRYDWDGQTWKETDLGYVSGIQQNDGFLDAQVLAREDFYVILYRSNTSVYRERAYGRKSDGVTWDDFKTGVVSAPGVGNTNALQLVGGNDFYAIANPKEDRIEMYRWNNNSWKQFYQFNNTPGDYYYTAANNYVIQHNEDTSPDTVKLFYYDITKEVQQETFNMGLETTGSGNYPSFWYGSNSFAQVNANANPEYFMRWDKDYNFLSLDTAPFGAIPDDSETYSFNNTYFASALDWNFSSQRVYPARYSGNGVWTTPINGSYVPITGNNFAGFGSDFFIYPTNYQLVATGELLKDDTFEVFNANLGQWQKERLSTMPQNGSKKSYDVFGSRYAFLEYRLYRQNSDLSFLKIADYPSNTIFSKADGVNGLYISSRNGNQSNGNAFAMLLSATHKNDIAEVNLPNDYYLWKNPYKNFSTHALGYGTYILKDETGNNHLIYRLIDGELQYNNEGVTVQKDIVIAKETFDPVISRKQRQYYCFSNPQIDKQNMRVFYSTILQQNDVNGILGTTANFYDKGDTDIRRQGLPLKTLTLDANNNKLLEQENTWTVRTFADDGSYYINLLSKETTSFEENKKLITNDYYSYRPENGLLSGHRMEDSEGNIHLSETNYLYEISPEVLDYNLLQPVAYTKDQIYSASEEIYIDKTATAVDWNVTDIPYPQNSYAWNGNGSSNFDFDNIPSNFRQGQEILQLNTSGNVIEEKNRSAVITSYIYGYGGKRLVAKIEGAGYDEAIALVNTTVIDNPNDDDTLINELAQLRLGLPDAFVTIYTYRPSIGMTSMTDARGRTTRYVYDNFYRLSHVVNDEGHILKKNEYTYREAPFNYTAEPSEVLDCPLINTEIIGDPNGEEPLPFRLTLVKSSGDATSAFFQVNTSGEPSSSYNLQWLYNTVSGDVANFPYTLSGQGTNLNSTNPNCDDGVLSVAVIAVNSSGETIAVSNTLNHTYGGPDCNPQ